MNSAVALHPGLETRWTIMNGSMRGAVRLMNQSQFTVGRNPECEFIITNDPKCSRRQAGVRVTSKGCEVLSLNDKNLVLVNGREVESALLNEGDVITFGETEVRFSTAVAPQPMIMEQPAAQTQLAHSAVHPLPKKRRARQANPQGNAKRFVIYGVVALLLYWIFGTEVKKKEELGLRTEQQMNAEIESANKVKEARESENLKRVDPSIHARQAQENYVRGFRDYRKGQYERSVISFQACLALNPSHVLCNRYLRLSQRKFNEMIQYYVLLGRKYRDQNQFQSCRAAFRNVMVMVKDANNETYKLAKANYEACNAFIEGRF